MKSGSSCQSSNKSSSRLLIGERRAPKSVLEPVMEGGVQNYYNVIVNLDSPPTLKLDDLTVCGLDNTRRATVLVTDPDSEKVDIEFEGLTSVSMGGRNGSGAYFMTNPYNYDMILYGSSVRSNLKKMISLQGCISR